MTLRRLLASDRSVWAVFAVVVLLQVAWWAFLVWGVVWLLRHAR